MMTMKAGTDATLIGGEAEVSKRQEELIADDSTHMMYHHVISASHEIIRDGRRGVCSDGQKMS